jgi:hypothetical protein
MSLSRSHSVKAGPLKSGITKLEPLNIGGKYDEPSPSTSATNVPRCHKFEFCRVQLCVYARYESD